MEDIAKWIHLIPTSCESTAQEPRTDTASPGKCQEKPRSTHGALAARKLPALSSGRWHHVQLSPRSCWSQKCGLSRGVITCRMYAEKEDDGKPSQQVLEHLRIRWTQVFSLGSEDIA